MSLKELEKRLRDEPDNLGLRVTVAGAYHEAGRVKEAVELYRSVAIAYRDEGRRIQALAVCRSILSIAPDDKACQALVADLDAPIQPDPLPPPPIASKRVPLPDSPAPPRRPEVLITRISSSDRLDETPLPTPMPYHVADPTAAISKFDRESITGVIKRPSSQVGTDSPRSSLPAARGSHVDVTAELDTRQRVRISTDELDKLAPPPRLATPLPIMRGKTDAPITQPVELPTDENPALTTKMERITDDGEPDPDFTAETPTVEHEDEAEPLPPVRTSSKPGITSRTDKLPVVAPRATTQPRPLPPITATNPVVDAPRSLPPITATNPLVDAPRPPPPPAPGDGDTEDEMTRPHEVFEPTAIKTRASSAAEAGSSVVLDPVALSFFSHLPIEKRANALARFLRKPLAAHEVVIARDDAQYPFVLLLRGQLEVRPRIGRAYFVNPGEYAGEASMLAKAPSRETVLATVDSTILALAPADFYDIVASYPALWAELKATARRRAMASL